MRHRQRTHSELHAPLPTQSPVMESSPAAKVDGPHGTELVKAVNTAHATAVPVQQPAAAAPLTTPPKQIYIGSSAALGASAVSQLVGGLVVGGAPPTLGVSNNNSPVKDSIQDLFQYISSQLTGTSVSGSQSLASAQVGTFLSLTGITLSFSASQTGGVWSGTVGISVTSATLYSGKSFSGTITGSPAISGTYTIGSNFSLTLGNLTLTIGSAVKITASGITLNYNPNGGPTQTLTASPITTATVTSPEFTSFPTATLSNLTIGANGFSFTNFTLTFTGGQATPSETLLPIIYYQ